MIIPDPVSRRDAATGRERRIGILVAIAAVSAIAGTLAAAHYYQLDLTLSHYDARGHLVVARRIFDSLTPGWQQIGAVWLPLPHLLNALPVQLDAFYRTGASGVALSVLAFTAASTAIAWIAFAVTGSALGAAAAAAVFALNPNVLYLQATPMTEPLLIALTTAAVALLMAWCVPAVESDRSSASASGGLGQRRSVLDTRERPGSSASASGGGAPRESIVGWAFALACLTRYEAWPVTVCALCAAVWAHWRRGDSAAHAAKQVGRIAAYPALAIAAFLVFSRVVIGQWFVAGGFFVPDNKALGSPIVAAAEIWWGLQTLSGPILLAIGSAGTAALAVIAILDRRRAHTIIALSVAAAAALPWAAFLKGHPFRIRYMVPLLAIEAIGVGVAIGMLDSRRRTTETGTVERVTSKAAAFSMSALIVAVGALLAYELRPLDMNASMVTEAQWDRPNVAARRHVTGCIGAPRPGAKIMASMGSLGHYMQEASREGFAIRDFLHEGNGDVWLTALNEGPRRFADWVLIEETAEGGDMLAEIVRERPQFLAGYSRACEGAGLALYRRDGSTTEVTKTNGGRGSSMKY